MRLKVIRVRTKYWHPGTDWILEIIRNLQEVVSDGDLITISEKAISTAEGLIIDESKVKPSSLAKFLAGFWTRKIWGGPLGCLTKLRQKTLFRLKNYPYEEGSAHKQATLRYSGLLQSLRHYSEGGIDASNLPFSLVSLPLSNPKLYAQRIKSEFDKIGITVSVLIVDGDTTYSWRNLHLSPRKVTISGLLHFGGFLTFVIGRILGFKSRSTPIAFTESTVNPDWALTMANVAHRVRGHGAGRTVWDMIKTLETRLTEVTWKMLEGVKHFPIVVIREIR